MFKKVTELDEFSAEDLYGAPDEDGELPEIILTSFIQHFMSGEFSYLPIQSVEQLSKVLEAKLEEYNNSLPAMNLVLFRQAMEHITRISRIVQKHCGNALLLGVGGSGKQSLAKLSTYLHETTWFQILIKGN